MTTTAALIAPGKQIRRHERLLDAFDDHGNPKQPLLGAAVQVSTTRSNKTIKVTKITEKKVHGLRLDMDGLPTDEAVSFDREVIAAEWGYNNVRVFLQRTPEEQAAWEPVAKEVAERFLVKQTVRQRVENYTREHAIKQAKQARRRYVSAAETAAFDAVMEQYAAEFIKAQNEAAEKAVAEYDAQVPALTYFTIAIETDEDAQKRSGCTLDRSYEVDTLEEALEYVEVVLDEGEALRTTIVGPLTTAPAHEPRTTTRVPSFLDALG